MARIVEQVLFPDANVPKLIRVAAYARVSSGKDAMLHSLSAQISFYSDLIQRHHGWQYVGVYADEALSGTKDTRENFQRLLADCKAGNVDMVITKSISRFARNTVTLLESVRVLKSMGIDVYFEEQNIHTMSGNGELMMTILVSYAQEESLSASENQKWRIRKNFEEGKPWNGTLLGYRYDCGKYVIVPEEAKTVKAIYADYLSGMGVMAIAKKLIENGIPTRLGTTWCKTGVSKILRNYIYTGNLLLQKTYRENHLTKKTLINHGELPQYNATDTHKAIIDMDTFMAVQSEIQRRAEKHPPQKQPVQSYPFTGMLICDNCGKHYRRKITAVRPVWICSTFNTMGKEYCASKQIPEETLYQVTAKVLGLDSFDTNAFQSEITAIRVKNDNTLVFCFKDGTESVKRWQDRSRAESWSDEMKSAARQKKHENLKSSMDSTI
jgi:site-specific DNA recombinase